MFKKNLGNKNINLFALFKRDNPSAFLTITVNKNEVIEYAESLIKFDHQSHFEAWCKLRELDSKAFESWNEYLDKCVSIDEKQEYLISKISYKLKDVAAIIRMFGGCVPLGCSFDTPIENSYAIARSQIKDIEDQIEKNSKEGNK